MNKKKKILYVHHGGGLGGAPRSLAFLINELDKNEYEPLVLQIRDGPARQLFEKVGATVIVDTRISPFHGTTVSGMNMKILIKNLLSVIPSYYYSKKIIKRLEPDIIHLNTTCLFIVAKACKKIKNSIPIITHVREPLLTNIFGKILRYYNWKYIDGYIAIEEYDMSLMNTKNKLHEVIYNFVDFTEYSNKYKSNVLREELSLSNEEIIFLFLGRISKENGLIELINILNKMTLPNNFSFVFVGFLETDDNYQHKVKLLSKNNDKLHCLNFRNDISDLIASSDVIMSFFIEPHFSRSVIEGAAMGKPSIVSNVLGQSELVLHNETGFIVDMSDEEEIKRCLVTLGKQKKLRMAMGDKACKFAKNNFDAKKNVNKILDIYNKL